VKKALRLFLIILSFIAVFVCGFLFSRSLKPDLPYATPTFTLGGNVIVPAFELPPSEYMSDAARQLLTLRAAAPIGPPDFNQDVRDVRDELQTLLSTRVAAMRQRYAVDMTESEVAGVPVRIFTPADAPEKTGKVLVNLHGGAFSVCWESCSILESVPIASVGGYRVVSVNYRMAPEAKHPAAVEDVTTVYRELLKDYEPRDIGIYGCSAGGALTAQAAAKFAIDGIPEPGAIGIFGAGAVRFTTGDSAYVSAYIDGSFPPPAGPNEPPTDRRLTRGYFDGADMKGPIVSPGLHLEILKQFPATMLITGTRAMDLSPAAYTNSQLIKAGVPTTFIAAEGMGHCYLYMSDFTESRDAYDAITGFFDQHLGE